MNEQKSNVQMICDHCAEKLKEFWQKENANLIIRSGDFIKVKVKGKDKENKDVFEHSWFVVNGEIKQNIYDCALRNNLAFITNSVVGDQYAIKFEDIEDHIPRTITMEEYNSLRYKFIERFNQLYPHDHENARSDESTGTLEDSGKKSE